LKINVTKCVFLFRGGDDLNQKIEQIRKQVTQLGKEVAESHSTTEFPEWIHFKIGLSQLQGIPYQYEYWKERMEPGCSND
jgi:hypothetical protein